MYKFPNSLPSSFSSPLRYTDGRSRSGSTSSSGFDSRQRSLSSKFWVLLFLFPLFLRVHFFMDDFFGKGAWDLRIMKWGGVGICGSCGESLIFPIQPHTTAASSLPARHGSQVQESGAPLKGTGPLPHCPTGEIGNGPLAHWPTGPLAHWPTGPLPILAHWPTGPLPGENGVRSRGATVSSPGFLPSPGGEMVSSPGFLPSPPCLRGRSFHFTQVVTPRRLVVVLKGSHHGGQQSPGSPWFSSGHTAAASSLPAAVVLKWSPHHGDQQSPGSSWFSSGEGGVNATAASSLPARRGS